MKQLLTLLLLLTTAACGAANAPQVFQATVPPTQNNAPVYSPTPTLTPSYTPTITPSPTHTLTPTLTPTATLTSTRTPSPTLTPSLTPTVPLLTLTSASSQGAPPPFNNNPAEFAPTAGWSCGDFPCEDDIAGFMQRIHVPQGYTLEYVGRFPGQPMQITYGPAGRLYATVLENGTRSGAVYVMDADGSAQRYSGDLISPIGLAFQPGTDVLYVSGRVTLEKDGGLWRVLPDGMTQAVLTDLPCCYTVVDNQPNGLVFGPDGWLYMGIGALTDHDEPPDPTVAKYAKLDPLEAAILRINPHTAEVQVYANGLRNPYDLTFDSTGQFYATDSGLLAGPGDRLLKIDPGAHYGWPYWRTRGCGEECPPTDFSLDSREDLLAFKDYSLPRGLVAYTGTQFPANHFDHLFVVLWNGTDYAQQVLRIDPRDWRLGRDDYAPEPFVTGLIRPVDVALAPDGSLVVADYIYGHIWRVRYIGNTQANPQFLATDTPSPQGAAPVFATVTPRTP